MNDYITENSFIEGLVKNFIRSPGQINSLQESDAELILLPDVKTVLAVTTDSISEEISTGLYSDLYQAGWMSVMINLSDLAAVGAAPLGLVMQETFTANLLQIDREKIQQGINDAVKRCDTYILGGDTNTGSALMLGGTAVGLLASDKILTRKGSMPGELLYTTGGPGLGNAYAFEKMFVPKEKRKIRFHPEARVKEGMFIRAFASACIDSSDGFLAALDQLMRVNGFGFQLYHEAEKYAAPEAVEIASAAGIDVEILLSAIHGDFELVFTITQEKETEFLTESGKANYSFKKLGEVTSECSIGLLKNGELLYPDTGYIRNLYSRFADDPQGYLRELTNAWQGL